MLRTSRLPLLIFIIIILNGLIYLRAFLTINEVEKIFAECARNSGRISAGINLAILIMLSFLGLKTIFKKENTKDAFRVLITLFAINHLIHFFFVYRYFDIQLMEMNSVENLHGFITYMSILLVPILLWTSVKLNKLLYFIIIVHIFNVTYFIMDTFYNRYKPEDPAYLHRLGIVIMLFFLLRFIYKVFQERSIKFGVEKQ